MPRIEDFKKNLLDMTPDELRARIREIRADRRIPKVSRKAHASRAKAADKTRTNLIKLLEGMSPEEQEKFLRELDA